MADPRVLFFGMDGPFSALPLAAILTRYTICGVVVPRPTGLVATDSPVWRVPSPTHPPYHIPLLTMPSAPSTISLAQAAGIPVLAVSSPRDQRTRDALAGLQPDLICVACFPRLLPPALLNLPRYGGLNLHPSLLPDYRGPAPLFWVFHDGLEHAGVTIHALDEGADTGDILAQTRLALPDGISYDEAERRCAQASGRLLLDTLPALVDGSVSRRSQSPAPAPAAPMPGEADFVISHLWSARRAFNFIRGIGGWGRPIHFASGARRFTVASAISYESGATQADPVHSRGGHLSLRCSPGVLTVSV